jgi:hypothetical protein
LLIDPSTSAAHLSERKRARLSFPCLRARVKWKREHAAKPARAKTTVPDGGSPLDARWPTMIISTSARLVSCRTVLFRLMATGAMRACVFPWTRAVVALSCRHRRWVLLPGRRCLHHTSSSAGRDLRRDAACAPAGLRACATYEAVLAWLSASMLFWLSALLALSIIFVNLSSHNSFSQPLQMFVFYVLVGGKSAYWKTVRRHRAKKSGRVDICFKNIKLINYFRK